ncbi:altronate dehydratase, partial [Yersinia enterocolitica]|nr:altronate dehydratase [Yersinia enterocolitica]
MQKTIKIHPLDNVAVALSSLEAGEQIDIVGDCITLLQAVSRGHKLAIQPLQRGQSIIKYGLPIGHTLSDIAVGEHIHSQNAKTNLSDLDHYSYQPEPGILPPQMAEREVQIYRRSTGDVGIRNELWIIPTVGCVNGIA